MPINKGLLQKQKICSSFFRKFKQEEKEQIGAQKQTQSKTKQETELQALAYVFSNIDFQEIQNFSREAGCKMWFPSFPVLHFAMTF